MDLSKVAKVDKTCIQWLCKPLKNFLWAQTTHLKFTRGCLEPGECSAHRIMFMHCIKQKIRNENLAWIKSKNRWKIDFKNRMCPRWAKATKMTPVTLQASKIFLWVKRTHTEYPRCRHEPGECSAHWIMVIRRLEQKVRIENEKSSKIHLESGFDMRISNCRISF